jgi:hypothetical protein
MAPITSTAVDTALAPNRFKDFWWSHEGEGFTIDVYNGTVQRGTPDSFHSLGRNGVRQPQR